MKKRRRWRRWLRPVLVSAAMLILLGAIVTGIVLLIHSLIAGPKHAGSSSSQTSSAVSKAASSAKSSSAPRASSSPNKVSSASSSRASRPATQTAPFTQNDAKYFSGAAFLGDSLTEGLEYFSVMDDATLLGETGLSTYTALTHPQTIGGKKVMVADAVKAAKPSVIYVMLGSNEINWMAQGDYIKYYDKLIDTLQKGSPQAQIEIESILPVTASYEKRYPDRSNSHIDQFNGALRLMCNSRGLKFLDIASVMKDEDGKLPSSASDDGIHLRAPYYNRWISYLLANK